MVHAGVNPLLAAILTLSASFGYSSVPGDAAATRITDDPALATDISTALFQVSSHGLTITRDIAPQLVFDDSAAPQAASGNLHHSPDTAWLDYLQASLPTAPAFTPAQDTSAKIPVAVEAPRLVAEAAIIMERPKIDSPTLIAHQPDPLMGQEFVDKRSESTTLPGSVPDPGPLGFLGLGLIALALARRMRRGKTHREPTTTAFNTPPPVASGA